MHVDYYSGAHHARTINWIFNWKSFHYTTLSKNRKYRILETRHAYIKLIY